MNHVVPSESAPSSGVDAQNPWPGLVAFTEELQNFFYGRAEEADELLRRVARKDLTVLFGQSGLGKSSLLQAGLFPGLRAEGYLPVAIRLDHAATAPPLSQQVITAVTRAILDAGGRSEATGADSNATLWEHFHRRSLCQQTQDGLPIRLVMVLDQFEELFAIGHASEETRARAARFLTELADLIENRAPDALERRLEESPELVKEFVLADRGHKALICLREDYLPHLEDLQPLMPSVAENRMRLSRMNGLRALEAVLIPGGDLITTAVGRLVVQFVAGGRLREIGSEHGERADDRLAEFEVEPSLLNLVCRELNDRRLARDMPQITTDLLTDNREGILQDFYEQCAANQPPAVRVFIEERLLSTSGYRENMTMDTARHDLESRGVSEPAVAIDQLVKHRLLHVEERLGARRIELTHDRIAEVIVKSREERRRKDVEDEKIRQAQEAAKEQVRQADERTKDKLRGYRRSLSTAFVVLIFLSGLLLFSMSAWREARENARKAEIDGLTTDFLTWRTEIHEKLVKEPVTDKALIEALKIPFPSPRLPDDHAALLRRDLAMADVLLSYPGVQPILQKRFGIHKEFLGTGLVKPRKQEARYSEAIWHEYLVPNYPDTCPYVWTWQLDQPDSNPHFSEPIKDLIAGQNRLPPNKTLDLTRKPEDNLHLILERLNDKDLPPVIRFARFAKDNYKHTMGRPEAFRVFANNLAEVWELPLAQAAARSGYDLSSGDTFFIWIFLPFHRNTVVPATWGDVLVLVPEWSSDHEGKVP